MISLPIPDRDAAISYSDVQRDGINFGGLVASLTRGKMRRDYRLHLDPDLDANAVCRRTGWRPVFGQQGAALAHLHNQEVGPGDLFLFFGWFRHVEPNGDGWRFVHGSRPVHALWGWMMIGAIHACQELPAEIRAWASGHPHLHGSHPDGNDLFVAADQWKLSGRTMAGAGLFCARPLRVLTAPGRLPSVWSLPAWMHPQSGFATLTYHSDRSRWHLTNEKACLLNSVAKGQEFVLHTHRQDLLSEWLTGLFADVPSVTCSSAVARKTSRQRLIEAHNYG